MGEYLQLVKKGGKPRRSFLLCEIDEIYFENEWQDHLEIYLQGLFDGDRASVYLLDISKMIQLGDSVFQLAHVED